MLTCYIAACSSQPTHGRLPSIAMLIQDDLLLARCFVGVLPLDGLDRVLVRVLMNFSQAICSLSSSGSISSNP